MERVRAVCVVGAGPPAGARKIRLRRGRVQFPKASRTQVQEEAAEAVMTALVEYLRELRSR